MQIYFDTENLPEIFFQASIFLIVYIIFYKRYIYSVLDPLFIYILTISFSSVLVINTLGETEPVYAFHFFLCHLFFFLGFSLITHKSKSIVKKSSIYFHDFVTFRIILYILCSWYFLTNFFLFYVTGFALLSDDPSVGKINVMRNFGGIYFINTCISSFILTGLFFSLFFKPKFVDFLLLLACIIISSLTGSKGAFVQITGIVILVANQLLFRHNSKIVLVLRLTAPIGIAGIFIVAFSVLLKENIDSEQATLTFVKRLLYGADSTLFFYQPVNEQYFAQFRFWQYPGYLFNQILAFFKLVAPQEAHGNTMIYNVLHNDPTISLGPNTPYYIEGQIYFGYYGAFIYSAFIGACYAFCREKFLNGKFYSAFSFVLVGCIANQASAFPVEASFGITTIFHTCFYIIPMYIVVNLIIHKKIVWRKIRIKRSFSNYT